MRAAAAARLALSLLVEPGDPRLPALLAGLGPEDLLAAVRRGRVPGPTGVPRSWAERVPGLDGRVAAAQRRAGAAGLRWVCPGEPAWPTALDDLDHVEPLQGSTGAPLGLWVRGAGDPAALAERSVAVVGARDCTAYGAECASDLAADAADHGFTVVSGGAYGIDASAHRGALALGRPTVAVLACGADLDYPRAHAALLGRAAETGLVLSEQAPGQVPIKARFLSRNRLIAALAGGTVVVEAAARSGSLNTLGWGDRLGRVTMAVPGPVTSRQSAGTHEAIRDGKAVLVVDGRQVVTELEGLGAQEEPLDHGPATEYDRLPATVRRTLDALEWERPRDEATLCERSGVGRHDVGVALRMLAARGLASAVDGRWVLSRRADLA